MWRKAGESAQNVGGECAIVCAAFDDSPVSWCAGLPPFPEKSAGKQLAEKRPDAHTGEKISASSDLPGFLSVVAELRFVESAFHEIREAEWPGV